MTKKALITGITGQDGHYLAWHLLGLGYEVYGLVRRTSAPPRLPDERVKVVYGDMTDLISLIRVVEEVGPDEVYNLAAQSYIVASFQSPLSTGFINGLGAHSLFEAVRLKAPNAKVYQAGTSEMFGGLRPGPYNEETPFHPRSPYAAAKVYAHHMAVHYREAYGMFISNGILFNHESPLRGEQFVTRKITKALGEIHRGERQTFTLGNLTAKRDWGFAGDYVRAMHLMLQQPAPDDFVVATGESHSVREFLTEACEVAGLDPDVAVTYSESDMRPSDVPVLTADPSKARSVLGWEPTVSFHALVRMMVESDL